MDGPATSLSQKGFESGAENRPRTALVLSAGGMFGAYQAGAWKALAGRIQPDVVIGASVGALNAWAIAGGAAPAVLADYWLDAAGSQLARFCWQRPWRGVFDAAPLHARIRELWRAWPPRTGIGVVATELSRLRPRLFRDSAIRWEHLAASCAVLLCYQQMRVDGKWYTDGGLLSALPLWAAGEAGAQRVIAVNALPRNPSRLVSGCVKALRAVAPRRPPTPAGLDLITIAPRTPLGSLREAVIWHHDAVRRWIDEGQGDAELALADDRLEPW